MQPGPYPSGLRSAAGAAMVADLIDDCVKGDDGVWRYARRDFVPLYMSGAELTVAPAALRSPDG